MRLTKKEKNTLASHGYNECDYLLNGTPRVVALNKLGQLEDIEDELGIDLITLFKALKNGIYVKLLDYTKPIFKKVIIQSYNIDIKKKYIDIRRDKLYNGVGITGGHLYPFKDYGKTWALTKEELL